jgi:hypothetical protein
MTEPEAIKAALGYGASNHRRPPSSYSVIYDVNSGFMFEIRPA